MKKISLTLMLFAISLSALEAADEVGSRACVFLRDAQGARAAAMGGAFTAVGSGVESVFWNPAGMSFGEDNNMEVAAGYNTLIEDISSQNAAFLYRIKSGKLRSAVSFSGVRLGMDSIEKRDALGNKAGSSSVYSAAYALGYGLALNDNFGLGVNVKSVQEKLGGDTGRAVAFDVGAIFRNGEYSFGVSALNFGGKYSIADVENDLASSLKAGAAYQPNESFDGSLKGLTLAADIEKPVETDPKLHLGVEYIMVKSLSFRGGYEQIKDLGSGSGFSAGIGFWTDFKPISNEESFTESKALDLRRSSKDSKSFILEIDYAYLIRDVFDDLHRVTLSFKF